MLVFDLGSFRPDLSPQLGKVATEFLAALPTGESVGLYAYPAGPMVDPTADRTPLRLATSRLWGRREAESNEFNLDPAERVDLLADTVAHRGSDAANVIAIRCGADQFCASRLRMEASVGASEADFQIRTSIAHLRRLIDWLAPSLGRKMPVLVSSGLALSDRPGAGPDIGSVATELGQAAARAGVSVYTLFVDNAVLSQYAADRRTSTRTMNPARDSALRSRWLDQFTGPLEALCSA